MRERGKNTLALIPLNLDGYIFSDEYDPPKKDEITSRVAAEVIGWEDSPEIFNESVA